MAFTAIPRDVNKIKTKVALNMTKRQLICFGTAAVTGIPIYLFTRGTIGNTPAVLLMMIVMAPLFLLAMYERDGQPAEKIIRNYIRTKFYWAGVRYYRAENFYESLSKEEEVVSVAQNNKRTKSTIETKHSSGKKHRK